MYVAVKEPAPLSSPESTHGHKHRGAEDNCRMKGLFVIIAKRKTKRHGQDTAGKIGIKKSKGKRDGASILTPKGNGSFRCDLGNSSNGTQTTPPTDQEEEGNDWRCAALETGEALPNGVVL